MPPKHMYFQMFPYAFIGETDGPAAMLYLAWHRVPYKNDLPEKWF